MFRRSVHSRGIFDRGSRSSILHHHCRGVSSASRVPRSCLSNKFLPHYRTMASKGQFDYGIVLPNGSRIVHQTAANNKTVFSDLGFPVTMHELSANSHTTLSSKHDPVPFAGQIGLIDFNTSIRLPRHVHIAPVDAPVAQQKFTAERILVLNGMALVELNAEIYVIPPRTLVTIAPGVPHTWTACPPGVSPATAFPGYDADMLAGEGLDRCVSDGRFLMVYEYEEETGFFPTKQTETLERVEDYVRAPESELEALRFPALSADEVLKRGCVVWGRECRKISEL